MDYVKLSKEISFALRHKPEQYKLILDEQGFTHIVDLLVAINKTHHYTRPITKSDLKLIIATSDKVRHEILGDKIRALYGHSIKATLSLHSTKPPDILYHGTTHKALTTILTEGLKGMDRQYVHMSIDADTALQVGQRHENNPVLLKINAKQAYIDGINFFKGNEKIWLTKVLLPKYIF